MDVRSPDWPLRDVVDDVAASGLFLSNLIFVAIIKISSKYCVFRNRVTQNYKSLNKNPGFSGLFANA